MISRRGGAICVSVAWISAAIAADPAGIVRSAYGGFVTVESQGGALPAIGDKATIFFKMEGVDAEISVAEAHVHEITGGSIVLKIDTATGDVRKDQLARFHSARSTKQQPSPSVAPSSAPGAAYTPGNSSPERGDLMDAMRLDFYPGDRAAAHSNPKGVLFKVNFLKVHGDWACTLVNPINSAGKQIAEPRWGLLRRTGGRWSALDYMEALRPFPSEEAAQDALGMTPGTIAKLRRVFPDAPGDIFPEK